jgi:flagellar basal-body rod protein FlgC
MDFFTAMEISSSGMTVQRTRVNVASSNLANAQSTKDASGNGPYQRRDVRVGARPANAMISGGRAGAAPAEAFGATIEAIEKDQSQPRLEYDPGHPDANADGYVAFPNINVVEEMVDMITASRAYQAGITALDGAVGLAERAIGIGK